MDFSLVAKVFDEIESKSKRLEMTVLLADLFKRSTADEIKVLVYLCQGQLGPDFAKPNAGMAEKMVIQALAKASGYEKSTIEKAFNQKGDLGLVAEELIGKKTQHALITQTISVRKVFDNFIKISQTSGTGSQDLKLKLLAELLNSSSAVEARYITRISLEALRLGLAEATILDALAVNVFDEAKKDKKICAEIAKRYPDAKEKDEEKNLRICLHEVLESKFNIHPDLGRLAELLWRKGLEGLDELELEPGIPIRPSLAERLPTADAIIAKLGTCLVEAKYDGLRVAAHYDGKTVRLFSRRQEEVTAMFPELVQALRENVKAKSYILEGEAIAVNEETNEFYPFQVTMQRKRKYDVAEKAEEYPLKLFVFDLIYLNGKPIGSLPLRERRKKMKAILKTGKIIRMTESKIVDKAKDLDAYFNELVARGLEGVIAKDLSAPYIAGARKFAWIKLKRSYKSQLTDTIDCVVLGYYKGKGKRTEFGLGGLLAGIYDDKNRVFKSIARVGTGFSEEMLSFLHDALEKIKIKSRPNNVLSNLEPDVWVSPQIVVEINADEITESPIHTAAHGLALRFPRLVKIREKKAVDCTTEKEIVQLFQSQRQIKAGE